LYNVLVSLPICELKINKKSGIGQWPPIFIYNFLAFLHLSLVPQAAEAMTRQFLSPCLFGCRDSERLREAVLTAVSELAQALKRMRDADAAAGGGDGGGGGGDAFVMSQHEELLHSAIAVLQE
jgi:hypothetical protein